MATCKRYRPTWRYYLGSLITIGGCLATPSAYAPDHARAPYTMCVALIGMALVAWEIYLMDRRSR